VSWIVSTSQGTPPTLPKFRVLRLDAYGSATPMSSTATGADANGFFYPTVGSSGWYQGNVAQSCTLTIDTDNVIANASYEYVLEIDEQQGQTGFPFSAVCLAQTPNLVSNVNVVPYGSQTVDGVATGALNVLLTNQTDPTQNGLWGANGVSSWNRVPINLQVTGAIFWVSRGQQLGQTSPQCCRAARPRRPPHRHEGRDPTLRAEDVRDDARRCRRDGGHPGGDDEAVRVHVLTAAYCRVVREASLGVNGGPRCR
jgi:hypothetical protein